MYNIVFCVYSGTGTVAHVYAVDARLGRTYLCTARKTEYITKMLRSSVVYASDTILKLIHIHMSNTSFMSGRHVFDPSQRGRLVLCMSF